MARTFILQDLNGDCVEQFKADHSVEAHEKAREILNRCPAYDGEERILVEVLGTFTSIKNWVFSTEAATGTEPF